MQAAAIRTEVLATLAIRANEIDRQIDMLSRCLVGDNTVVRTSPGLYLRYEGDQYRVCGIECSSRYPRESAERVAANVTNGFGDVATAVNLQDALREERDELIRLAAVINALPC